jgi:hypothetical protein
MLNQATIDLVKEFEGLRTTAYNANASASGRAVADRPAMRWSHVVSA